MDSPDPVSLIPADEDRTLGRAEFVTLRLEAPSWAVVARWRACSAASAFSASAAWTASRATARA